MLDALWQSYFHGWTLKGAHACFATYTQHLAKCKASTIPPVEEDHIPQVVVWQKKKTMISLLTRICCYQYIGGLFDMKVRFMVCFSVWRKNTFYTVNQREQEPLLKHAVCWVNQHDRDISGIRGVAGSCDRKWGWVWARKKKRNKTSCTK